MCSRSDAWPYQRWSYHIYHLSQCLVLSIRACSADKRTDSSAIATEKWMKTTHGRSALKFVVELMRFLNRELISVPVAGAPIRGWPICWASICCSRVPPRKGGHRHCVYQSRRWPWFRKIQLHTSGTGMQVLRIFTGARCTPNCTHQCGYFFRGTCHYVISVVSGTQAP